MQIFQVSRDEFLLCFNEFGVFVNESGNKTQCDLKWNKVPCDFGGYYTLNTFCLELVSQFIFWFLYNSILQTVPIRHPHVFGGGDSSAFPRFQIGE